LKCRKKYFWRRGQKHKKSSITSATSVFNLSEQLRNDRADDTLESHIVHLALRYHAQSKKERATVPSAGRERDAGCTQLLAGLPRALEHPEAGATTAEAFAFKKEIQALARMARQTMAAIVWRILARHDRQHWGESGRSTMRPTWPFRRWSLQFRSRLSGEGRIGFVGDSRCSRGASPVHDSSPCRNIRAIPAPSPSRPGPSGRIADAGDGEDRGKSARCIHFSGIPALRKPA
jgi:hypothetical protein